MGLLRRVWGKDFLFCCDAHLNRSGVGCTESIEKRSSEAVSLQFAYRRGGRSARGGHGIPKLAGGLVRAVWPVLMQHSFVHLECIETDRCLYDPMRRRAT